MRRLTVLRHAKSSWGDKDLDDFNRPLNDRGWKSARRIGKEMKRRKMRFDFAVASPAARVRETIDGLVETYGSPTFPIHFDSRVYMATAPDLIKVVREIPSHAKAVLLVGHNPGLEQLIVALAKDDRSGLRARVADKYPTGALAVIEFDIDAWREVGEARGELTDLIVPRDLD
jgi:phosphohistidine phosphatase